MAPFRNPFQRKPPPLNGVSTPAGEHPLENEDGFVKTPDARSNYSSSRASSALSIKPVKEPDEFKMSVVNDSGVYLPPSPTEKRGFWKRTPTSTTTTSHRSMLSEAEPFSISRESFESYRRSFDISARSPVIHPDAYPGRQSLDSWSPRNARTSNSVNHGKEPERLEEELEDVSLEDPKPKKKGLFSRFGEMTESNDENARPNSSHGRFHLPGRKRGQSGQGAELGSMPDKQQNNPVRQETSVQ